MNAITRLFSRLSAKVKRMFYRQETVIIPLNDDSCVSFEMQDAQELWRSMYMGFAPWNGEQNCGAYTKNITGQHLASAVCRKIAQNATLEFESYIVGESERAVWL